MKKYFSYVVNPHVSHVFYLSSYFTVLAEDRYMMVDECCQMMKIIFEVTSRK